MKITTLVLFVLLFAVPSFGQELQHRDLPAKPEPVDGVHVTVCRSPDRDPIQKLRIGDIVVADGKDLYCPEQLEADGLVLAPAKIDGQDAWEVKPVGSCFWCGEPMSFKKAAFDNKSLPLWGVRTGLLIADVEITHRSPCFQAGTCREMNPILGQTRAQAYGVGGAILVGSWMLNAYLRKGDTSTRMGGLKWWQIVPLAHSAVSVAGIIANLARN